MEAGYFYQVLQERATTVLKEKGVDPVTHRGATPLRAGYYALVFSCWIMAGSSHLQVRTFGICWENLLEYHVCHS